MAHRLAMACRSLLVAAAVAGSHLAAAAAAVPADDEAYETLMYTALCRGILWPDGVPTQLASDTVPADVALELATRNVLAGAADLMPDWADDLSAEAAAGGLWRASIRDADPDIFRQVAGECRIHLEAEAAGRR